MFFSVLNVVEAWNLSLGSAVPLHGCSYRSLLGKGKDRYIKIY